MVTYADVWTRSKMNIEMQNEHFILKIWDKMCKNATLLHFSTPTFFKISINFEISVKLKFTVISLE
jgi:hypothetical protein